MFGKIEATQIAILVLSVSAAFTDFFQGKIYNALTIPFALFGLLSGLYFGGWLGLAQMALGIMAGLLAYGGLFWLRVMGGGDVKLLMALGAWGGPEYAIQVALLGIVLGGAVAGMVLLVKGRFLNFLLKIYRFLISLMIQEFEVDFPRVDHSMTIPFGVPIAAAALWVEFSGFRLWW